MMRERIGLDSTDIRILRAVQEHGQLSKARLAELVSLSQTPCWARLQRLRTAGYIRGYHADIALERILDVTRVIVTVSLKQHRKSDFERFEAHVKSVSAITNCVATGGGTDYILTVVAPSMAAFQKVVDDMSADEFNVDRYIVYFATRLIKADQPDLTMLLDGQRRTRLETNSQEMPAK